MKPAPSDSVPPLAIANDLDPVRALKDAQRLIEYAAMHTGQFSLKDQLKLEVVIDYLGDVIGN